jgi:hypothetical protein
MNLLIRIFYVWRINSYPTVSNGSPLSRAS